MIRSSKVTDEGGSAGATGGAGAGTSGRGLKYAVAVYAVVEFFAIALLLYYKLAR
jgi:hypothetical protein